MSVFTPTRSPNKFVRLLLICAVLLGFFGLWLWNLGYPSLSGDESFVAIFTAKPVAEIFQQLNRDEPHPPLYYLLMHSWEAIAGDKPEFIVRFPSLLIGLLLLSLVYRLGREIGLYRIAALITVGLVGFDPQLTVHLREARMYGPMVTSVALVALVAVRFEQLPSKRSIWIAAVVSSAALMTHYFTAFFVAAIGLWGLMTFEKQARRRWVLAQAIAWIVLAVWLPLFGQGFFNSTSLGQGKTWSFVLPPWETIARLIQTGVFGYRDSPELWLVIVGGALLIGGWLIGSWQAPRRQRLLLFIAVMVPLMLYALIGWFKPVFHPKYTLPWLLFVALGIGSLITRRPRLGGAIAIALVVVMFSPEWRTIRMPYDPGLSMSRNEWLRPLPRQLAQDLAQLAGPTDVFGEGTPDVTHCYYSQHYFDSDLGCALLPAYPDQPLDELKSQIAEILRQHAVLWYLDFYNPAWDPNRVADAAFAQQSVSLGSDNVGGNNLRSYTSQLTIVNNQKPVNVSYGGVAELAGVWVSHGNNLHVVLIWRGLADHPAVDAKVFVHVVDASGNMIAQDDSIPVVWTRPFNTWQRDEQLLDVHVLTLSPDAQLKNGSLRIGVYSATTSARLSAFDRTGRQLPDDSATIQIATLLPTLP